jgi:hypothetical protein
VVSFNPPPLYPRERTPDTHWIGDWVGPRAGLDAVAKRKIPSPFRESNSDHPAYNPPLSYPGSNDDDDDYDNTTNNFILAVTIRL